MLNSFDEWMKYNKRPRQDPCGTPQSRGRLPERASGMETRCLLADKYDLNQSNGAPEIPNEVWSLRNETVWSTVPKAALKSSNPSQRTACWEFFSIRMYIDNDTYTKRQMTVTSVKLKGGSEGLEQEVEAISVVFMRLSPLLCRGSRHMMHSR